MAIILEKKKPIDLTKQNPGLRNIVAGLGWDSKEINGQPVDCDVSLFMLGENNKIPGEGFFVFYNNLNSEDNSINHMGDNRDGDGDGDDEVINIDLSKVDEKIVQILFTVTIYESEARGHNFGNVNNAFIRIYNKLNGAEICRFSLTEQYSDSDSLLIGRLYRSEKEWNFEAMGDAFSGGLSTLVNLYN
ncbi:MAG: TerD family protein [Bacteroidetes bacterium]|nr:TerD family protein [Bacteroidota bacterium]